MSELLLIKTPLTVHSASSPPLPNEQVVGIAATSLMTTMEFGYRLTGKEGEESLMVSDEIGENIFDFFQRTRALSPENRPPFGCYLFVWYALGKAALERYDGYHSESMRPVSPTSMKAGKAYGVAVPQGNSLLSHAMLGTNRPDHSLSILNTGLPLAIVNNSDLLTLYNGVAIKHIVPEYAYSIDHELQ